jgi:hypothetical protein
MKIVVATDPGHDKATKHLSHWMLDILNHAKSLGDVEMSVLQGGDATQSKLTKMVEARNPSLIVLNGHGTQDLVMGFNNAILVSTDEKTLKIFAKKIVHALACESGKQLGAVMIKFGTKAFVGYTEKFEFYAEADPFTSTGKDRIASYFLDPANTVVKCLCEGDDARTAYGKSQDEYKKSLVAIYTSTDSYIATNRQFLAASVWKNLNSQTLLGDGAATV